MAQRNRFTIYDALDAKGFFDSNPANAGSRNHEGQALYAGPVEYPKMVYHPLGLERIVVPAEVITTPYGPKEVGEQRELICQVVNNPEEEAKMVNAGWHLHPAAAIQAAGKVAPETGAELELEELDRRMAALQAQREALAKRQPSVAAKPPSPEPKKAA